MAPISELVQALVLSFKEILYFGLEPEVTGIGIIHNTKKSIRLSS